MTEITFAIAQLCATDDCCDACGEDILSGVCVFYKDGDGCFQLHPGCITPGDPVLDKAVESARLIMDGDKAEFLTAKVANADAELARLRAELEQAPTATLRQQLAGSQSALSKVMGELTEAREQLERRRIDYAKVQADLYNQIEAEKAQTAEAYRQRDVARAALAEAERERDEARAEADNSWMFVGDVTDSTMGLLQEIERQRRTIRALVVAARAMWDVVRMYEGDTEDDQLRRDIRAVTVDFIKSAERGQAGKE